MTAIKPRTVTEDVIRVYMRGTEDPSPGIWETAIAWGLRSVRIDKRHPKFSDGFERDLDPTSHFYKRWFELADIDKRGWAIVFQVAPPESTQREVAEYFCGWVPPERGDEADQWISFLNDQIKDRLRAAGETKR